MRSCGTWGAIVINGGLSMWFFLHILVKFLACCNAVRASLGYGNWDDRIIVGKNLNAASYWNVGLSVRLGLNQADFSRSCIRAL